MYSGLPLRFMEKVRFIKKGKTLLIVFFPVSVRDKSSTDLYWEDEEEKKIRAVLDFFMHSGPSQAICRRDCICFKVIFF